MKALLILPIFLLILSCSEAQTPTESYVFVTYTNELNKKVSAEDHEYFGRSQGLFKYPLKLHHCLDHTIIRIQPIFKFTFNFAKHHAMCDIC